MPQTYHVIIPRANHIAQTMRINLGLYCGIEIFGEESLLAHLDSLAFEVTGIFVQEVVGSIVKSKMSLCQFKPDGLPFLYQA